MLFTFGYFWKFIGVLLAAWGLYGFVGYEFTVITLVAVLIGLQVGKM
jgi:hypothetical protein